MTPSSLSEDDQDYLATLVRETDRARYYATLLAPAPDRGALLALYAFAAEIERVPDQVRDANLGEIRLQWWRDTLDAGLASEGGGEAPALRGMIQAIRRHSLPVPPIQRLIEARRFDLYSDPPQDRAEMEGLLGETQSAVFQLAALILGASGPDTANLSGHAGVAYGLARRLAGLSAERARARTIIPADRLAAEGLSAAELFLPEPPAVLDRAVSGMLQVARDHLRQVREHFSESPRSVRPAFLPLAIVAPTLDRVKRLGHEVAHCRAKLSDLQALSGIVRAHWFGL